MTPEKENKIFRVNNHLCNFSRDGRFLAIAFQGNLIIKNTGTFDTFHSYVFVDVIEYIEWSLDNEYILCANIKRATVQVFSICSPDWRCKLTEGSAGLEQAMWAPDSKHIITIADFHIQISIWSLENKTVTYIQNLKSLANRKLEFSPNGKYLALILRDNGNDSVAIYRTNSWKISRKLICERLNSIDGICWSPNSELLCIWCSISGESKLLVYSVITESHVGVYWPKEIKRNAEKRGMFDKQLTEIEKVKWIPSGQLLAVAGYNELVVLLNYLTWKPFLELHYDPVINENNYSNKVYKEYVIHLKDPNRHNITKDRHILEEVNTRPINIPIAKDYNNGPLVAEVDILEFSACGRYLATKHQMYPTTLWIWDIIQDSVEYLLLQNTVSNVRWDNTCARLMVFTESSHMFQWCPKGVLCIHTPKGMIVSDARWNSCGKILVLCGYNKAAIYYI